MWSWVTPLFQAAVSDSINLRLIVRCLSNISKAILRHRLSIGFIFFDLAGKVSVLTPDAVLALPIDYQFGTMTLFPLSSFKQKEYWNNATLIAPRTAAVCRCIWSRCKFRRQCPT